MKNKPIKITNKIPIKTLENFLAPILFTFLLFLISLIFDCIFWFFFSVYLSSKGVAGSYGHFIPSL